MSSPAPSAPIPVAAQSHITRPLDAMAAAAVVMLCLSWGLNQIAVKLAMHDIPPLTQAFIRSTGATLLVAAWCWMRGIALFERDGTLKAGLLAGVLMGAEFVLIYPALNFTTASRSVLFLYMAPFFVVLGARIFLPADRFRPSQWLGLALSFIGMLVAFGLPTPAVDPRQMLGDLMMVAGALLWAGATLVAKASRLNAVSPEKTMLYQLGISSPMLALAAVLVGERVTQWPDAQAVAWVSYQTIWVVGFTYVIWFRIIKNYSANRVLSFTFLTPLFGVAAGHFVMGDPLTPAFIAAVVFVAAGLVLVNRP